jgi:glycosyltransferase involved in cell wall biosynthesis
MEPKNIVGGVSKVAYYLSRELAKKINITVFPSFKATFGYSEKILKIYGDFVAGRFEIVHFNIVPTWINGGYTLLELARTKSIGTILNIHGIIPLEHKLEPSLGRIPRMGLIYTLRACKLVDKIVVNSKHMKDLVVNWYNIRPEKIVVIPNGVNFEKFNKCETRVALPGDPAVLYVGKFSKRKGLDILFQAVKEARSELPKLKLHLIGWGDQEFFRRLAKKLGIEDFVVFHGWFEEQELPAYYKSADFCVFPSKYESFGLVFLEAMASGCPIIVTPVGIIPEIIIHGKNGLIVEPDNPDLLAKTILMLAHDVSLRKKLSQNAIETVKKYTWDRISELYIVLYKKLLEEKLR